MSFCGLTTALLFGVDIDKHSHPVERLARRDLLKRKRDLERSIRSLNDERTKTIKATRAAYKRGEAKSTLWFMCTTIMQADKQLEHLAVLVSRTQLCIMRLRHVATQRAMARAVDTAAQAMRYVNDTLRSNEELRDIAERMEREMTRYEQLQNEYDELVDVALAPPTSLSQLSAADEDDTAENNNNDDESNEHVESALREVLGDNRGAVPITRNTEALSDEQRLESIYKAVCESTGSSRPSLATKKVARAMGARNTAYASMNDSNDGDDASAGNGTRIEMQDMTPAAADAAATAAAVTV
jgi:hypothetical protein